LAGTRLNQTIRNLLWGNSVDGFIRLLRSTAPRVSLPAYVKSCLGICIRSVIDKEGRVMKLEKGVKTGVNILRFLALLVIMLLLIPRLFVVCWDLYRNIFNDKDREPYGNPMKVEAPYRNEQARSVIKFKL
jgi:hypothetical protein